MEQASGRTWGGYWGGGGGASWSFIHVLTFQWFHGWQQVLLFFFSSPSRAELKTDDAARAPLSRASAARPARPRTVNTNTEG